MKSKITLNILIVLVFFNCKNTAKETKTTTLEEPKKYITSLDKSIERGQLVYEDFCVNCHMANGEGSPKVFPPLAKSDYLKNNQQASIRGIKYGQSGEIIVNGETYNSVMAAQGLEDGEITDVMNYINNAWGNSFADEITDVDVAKITK